MKEIIVGDKIVHHYCGGSWYGIVTRVNKKSIRASSFADNTMRRYPKDKVTVVDRTGYNPPNKKQRFKYKAESKTNIEVRTSGECIGWISQYGDYQWCFEQSSEADFPLYFDDLMEIANEIQRLNLVP